LDLDFGLDIKKNSKVNFRPWWLRHDNRELSPDYNWTNSSSKG